MVFLFLLKTTDHMRFCTVQRTWIGVRRSTGRDYFSKMAYTCFLEVDCMYKISSY